MLTRLRTSFGRIRHRFAVGLAAGLAAGCHPTPPPDVPPEAVWFPYGYASGRVGAWAHCWVDEQHAVNRCRTYNVDGERFYRPFAEDADDDVFLRYEGTGPVPAAELDIDPDLTNPHYVWLKSGVVLIPRNQYEEYKEFIAEIMEVHRRMP